MSQSGVLNRGVYPPGTVVTKLSPSAGTIPVVPDFANNINLFSGNNITTTGTGANTIGFSLTGTTNHCIQIGNVTGSLTSLAAATDGQIPIGSTGLDPVIATITAGTNITVTNGPGSITISNPNGISWVEITGTTQAMAVDTGYIANNVALVTLTLPAFAVVGDRVRVAGKGAGLWRIAQNALQVIHFGATDSTIGIGGSVTAILRYDCVELLCITANTDWVVLSSVGNLTVV